MSVLRLVKRMDGTDLSVTVILRSFAGKMQLPASLEDTHDRQGWSPEHLILCRWQRWHLRVS